MSMTTYDELVARGLVAQVTDEDELKEALDRFEVTKSDYDMAYNEAKKLIELLENNKDKLKKFTDKYLNKMLKE